MPKLNRRHFIAGAALTVAASKFGNFTKAQRAESSRSNPAAFGPTKQIDAVLLNVSYVEPGARISDGLWINSEPLTLKSLHGRMDPGAR